MKKYTFIIFLSIVSISTPYIYAQDAVFSQPYANPLYLNPAFAGTSNSQRMGVNFRDEWPSNPLENNIIYSASYDANFIDTNNGIGFLSSTEKSGYNQDLTTTNISLIYTHQFHIKSFTLSAGAQVTYLDLSLDESKLVYDGPMIRNGWGWGPELLRNSITAPDFSGGILGYGKNYFAGFSIDHFTQPDESFYQGQSLLPIKYNANAGIMIPIGSVSLSPTVLYTYQKDFVESEMEVYVNIWHITAGIGGYIQSGSGNALANAVSMLGYKGKLLRIGYSYDWALSKLALATGGIHEGSLALLLPYSKAQRKKVSGLNCPTF